MTPPRPPALLVPVLIVFALAALPACSVTLGRPFPAESRPGLRIGATTEPELQQMFGDPAFQRVLQSGDFESTIVGWAYGQSTSSANKGHELHVETVDGIVNGWLFASSLAPDATDFDLNLASQLREGTSKLADAERILGPPGGRLRLPTGLLYDWFGQMKVLQPPAGATQAIVYAFLDLAVHQGSANRRLKLLVLFAGGDDTLSAVRRFEGVR
jgi:hypothetical protein